MNNEIPEPFLMFDFVNKEGIPQKRIFINPIEVIEAHSVDEVRSGLKRVQEHIKNGYFAAGFISYEAAPAFDSAYVVSTQHKMPLLWFGIFPEENSNLDFSWIHQFNLSSWVSGTTHDDYINSIKKIKDAIARGDTYQVNYTMRLRSQFAGDDLGYYNFLRNAQQANYSAFLSTGRFRVLSASPELFFRLDGRTVTTRPMKGTIPRGRWLEEDIEFASRLLESEKDKAENVMIVDLLRNDLSKIPGAKVVNVPRLFEIERYPTLYQMTSTVTATVGEDTTVSNVLEALFPCGSITGAPKISTMGLISELEKDPREIYCGTIGIIETNGDAVFNVAIRTLYIDSETGLAEYGVGGGVTWDSTAEGEYAEAFTKAALLQVPRSSFELLETLKLDHNDYDLLSRHLKRLSSSAHFFNIPIDLDKIRSRLNDYATQFVGMRRRVRLLVSQTGDIRIESTELQDVSNEVHAVVVAKTPILKQNRFLYHKTTNRDLYTVHKNSHPEAWDVLLWNEDEQITEFTNGNIVLEIDGHKMTPYRDCGLLAGTFREELLDKGVIQEAYLTHMDLKKASKVWFINSIRGWVRVHFVT